MRDSAWRTYPQKHMAELLGRGGAACLHLCWHPAPWPICINLPAGWRGSRSQAGRCKRKGGGKLPKESLEEMLGGQSNRCPLLRRKAHEKGDLTGERRSRQQGGSRAHCQGELTVMGRVGRGLRRPETSLFQEQEGAMLPCAAVTEEFI